MSSVFWKEVDSLHCQSNTSLFFPITYVTQRAAVQGALRAAGVIEGLAQDPRVGQSEIKLNQVFKYIYLYDLQSWD